MAYRNTSDSEIASLLRRSDPADHDAPLTAAEIEDLREIALAATNKMSSNHRFRGWMLAGTTAIAVLALALSYQMGRNAALEALLAYGNGGISRFEGAPPTQQELTASLLVPLSSSDPYQRQRALLIGETLGLESVRRVAEIHAVTERHLQTRLVAESVILGGPDADAAYQRLSARRQLRIELRQPHLRQLREDAQGYARGGAPNGAINAVQLFNQIIDALSPAARTGLDPAAISAAHLDAERGDAERAALRFMTTFATAAGEVDEIDQSSFRP